MAPNWGELEPELERLYLKEKPTKTIQQIKVIMDTTHGFSKRLTPNPPKQ